MIEALVGREDERIAVDPAPKRTTKQIDAFLRVARDRFKRGEEAETTQRARELDDLKFAGGDQWPSEIKLQRQGQTTTSNTPPVPARPCLVIDKTKEGVNNVLGELSQAELTASLVPADDFEDLVGPLDPNEVHLREGLLRRIFRSPDAETVALWAAERMLQAGRGFVALETRYVTTSTTMRPSASMFDQEVYVRGFYNQACVLLDPTHERLDGSDATWGFIGTDLPWDQYEATYPDAAKALKRSQDTLVGEIKDDVFRALGDEYPGWFKTSTGTDKTRSVRVVDYFYTVRTERELCLLPNGSAAWGDTVPAGAVIAETRTVVAQSIKRAILDGTQILDETDWPGPDIPIVKFTGDELQPYDGERRTQGLIRPARDSQQAYNYMVSKWVETIGLAPIPPLMIAAGQDEGFETEWNQMNTRTLGRLHYNQVDSDGRPAPPPQRPPVDTQISAIAGSIQIFDEGIQATIGVHDPTLGYPDHTIRSGKALQQVSGQNRQGTSGYFRNYVSSWRRIGEIANNLLFPIYGIRPGRIAQIVTMEGETQKITIGSNLPTTAGTNPTRFRLTPNAAFNVIVKVGRKYDSRRQQEASELGALIADKPELLSVLGDIWAKHLDGPGHDELAARLKVMLAPPVQAYLSAKAQGQDIPPQVQAQMQQGQRIIQQLTQHVNQLTEDQKTDKIKADRDLQKAALDRDKEIELQRMKDATAIAVAKINLIGKGVQLDTEAANEALALQQQQAHETHTAAADAGHEERMAQMGQQHEVGLAGAAAGHEADMGARAHEQSLEQIAAQPPAESAPT